MPRNIVFHLLTFSWAVVCDAETDPTSAVRGLLERVAGSRAQDFVLEQIPKNAQGKEVMGLSNRDGRVVLQGSTAVSFASAFNWYLNDFLNTTYDWSTYEIFIPSTLPMPPATQLARVVRFSYYMNVCTYGYSLAFVDWAYWEKHLDWMAMQGVNLPLAFLGQEKVLLRTFARFNISFSDMQQFISGPAFLPWFRMGNLQAWGGPITQHWIDSRAALQQKVLARMRELGMTPVLPAFSGFVPPAFAAKHPQANMTKSADWNSFPDPYGSVYLLEPLDPFFKSVGQAFVEEQKSLYGTDHIYQCDTYNEMDPRSGDLGYLASSSKAVLEAMQAGDSQAVWLMQGWLFVSPSGFWTQQRIQAYLDGVPNDKMWVLDLQASARPVWKETKSFYGKPYVWNTLQNYGGQQGIAGSLPQIATGFSDAMNSSQSPIGVGITMEGIWTNYIEYDLTFSQAWGRGGAPKAWARKFGARRYGPKVSSAASDVWETLYEVAYTGSDLPRSGPITTRPTLNSPSLELAGMENLHPSKRALHHAHGAASRWTRSNPGSLFLPIWKSLLEMADEVGDVKAFRFDLVDVGREVLTAMFQERRVAFEKAFHERNVTAAESMASSMLDAIDDFDRLLSTDENFMLGGWLASARNWGETQEEKRWLEFNARNQVTLWGPTGQINDYATKAWGGLTRAYFKPRWALLTRTALQALKSQTSFDHDAFNAEVLKTVEIPWQNATDSFPTAPEEDAVQVSRLLFEKYARREEHAVLFV